ncbi:MAG: putative oxidoreductase YciK [Candidatus Celerinatantimonas neptuna]|nr:MAG: putative oxidoreductase YciK [Candidatus Celerinatantimonas neptuna]
MMSHSLFTDHLHFIPTPDFLMGKTVLVSGASDGIGRCAAKYYSRFGADLILLGRNKDKLIGVAHEISPTGRQILAIPLDLSTATTNDYKTLTAKISSFKPQLDGALLSAGILGDLSPITDIDIGNFDEVFNLNVRSQLLLTQALLPLLLKASSSSLILTTSSVGKKSRATWGSYAISKFALEGLMQTIADEYSGTSLRTNCINPGATRTKMRAKAKPEENPMILKTPKDIMSGYLFLMDQRSIGINGQTLDAQPK